MTGTPGDLILSNPRVKTRLFFLHCRCRADHLLATAAASVSVANADIVCPPCVCFHCCYLSWWWQWRQGVVKLVKVTFSAAQVIPHNKPQIVLFIALSERLESECENPGQKTICR